LEKLTETKKADFGRGWIFRCKGKYPYESQVDFMLREEPEAPSGYALIVISGYSAGCTFQHLPKECLTSLNTVSAEWVQKNWSKWIYPECPIKDVHCYKHDIPHQ
jgi:hypothetical protein